MSENRFVGQIAGRNVDNCAQACKASKQNVGNLKEKQEIINKKGGSASQKINEMNTKMTKRTESLEDLINRANKAIEDVHETFTEYAKGIGAESEYKPTSI